MRPIRLTALTGLLAAALLSGCASVYLVDNQVRSYATWEATAAPAPGQTFRFERLPSQNEGPRAATQETLETPVRQALEQWGLKTLAPGDTSARWTVQVTAQAARHPRAPWDDPWPMSPFGFGGYGHVVTGDGRVVFVPALSMRMESPYFEREIAIVMRDASSGRVVYETRAAHDGRWNGTPALWAAMAQAALRDFPRPPAGVRQVNVEVPR